MANRKHKPYKVLTFNWGQYMLIKLQLKIWKMCPIYTIFTIRLIKILLLY